MKYSSTIRLACLLILMAALMPANTSGEFKLGRQTFSAGRTEATSPSFMSTGVAGEIIPEGGESASFQTVNEFIPDFSVCCAGITGNINGDAQESVDISDLTKLVNHLFVTYEILDCYGEANTNGDQSCSIDISDLTKLVNHLFVTFENLANCLPDCE
ncbi:MAG: hypothetical protein V3T31_06955 [candidate division Zixibacteria bacterium]